MGETGKENGSTAWQIAAIGVAVVVYLALAWRFEFHCDDSLISFRYSRNLADGLGLRFNVGAEPPVEGYSNFLWVIWIGLFELLDWDAPRWACLSSTACGVALLIAVTRFARRTFELRVPGTFAVGLYFATLPPLALWSTGGLATMPSALLLFLTYERLFDPRSRGWSAATFAVLTCLMRFDGAVWIAMLLLAAAAVWWFEGRPRELLVDLARVAGAVALVLLIHTLARLWYYGDTVPNTFHLKGEFAPVRLGRGLRYVGMWLVALPSITLVLIASARRWPSGRVRLWLPAFALLAGGVASSIWVGGDFLPMWRFLIPAHAFVVILLAAAWRTSTGRHSLRGPILSVVCISLSLAVCLGFSFTTAAVKTHLHFRGNRQSVSELDIWRITKEFTRRTTALGTAVARYTDPDESIVAGAIGGLGYYTDLFIYDRYGLVTRGVAANSEQGRGGAPGHDLRVSRVSFIPWQPTYLMAELIFEGETKAPLPPRRGGYPLSSMTEDQRIPLPPGEEYAGALELRLVLLKEKKKARR